jgi:hypothetical protein
MDTKRTKSGFSAYFLLAVFATTYLLLPLWPTNSLAGEWVYTVQEGDNLWDLTRKYMVSMRFWRRLQKLNQITTPRRIPPGTRLRMPTAWSKINPAGAKILALRGEAEITDGRSLAKRKARLGEQLKEHDRLATHPGSNLLLEFADGSRLLLTAGSELEFQKLQAYGDGDITDTRIKMKRGRARNRVNPGKKRGTRFEITTPSALSAVRGTGFRVSADASGDISRVEVAKGSVQVSSKSITRTLSGGFGIVTRTGKPPSQPVKLLPPPDLTGVPALFETIPFAFRFPPLHGAGGYRVQIAHRGNLDLLYFDELFRKASISVIDTHIPDGKYQLRIRGVDKLGLEGIDAILPIEINARPSPPFQVTPEAGASLTDPGPSFKWAHTEQTSAYHFQLATNTRFDQPLLDRPDLESEQFSPEQQLKPGIYYWRVTALDLEGKAGPAGTPQQFTITPKAPGTEPPILDEQGVTFHWRPGEPGQHYRFQVSTNPDFSNPLADIETDESRYRLPKPQPGTYYMRVKGITADGIEGPFGAPQRIEVTPPKEDISWVVLTVPLIMVLVLLL